MLFGCLIEDVHVIKLLATFIAGLVLYFFLSSLTRPLAEVALDFDWQLKILRLVGAVLKKEALSFEILTARRL